MDDLLRPRWSRAFWPSIVAGGLAVQVPGASLAQDADERNVTVRFGERLTHEDNLYRLPAGIDPGALLDRRAAREDVVSSTSIAVAGSWAESAQEVVLDTLVVANRFADNGELDNTSGRGSLDWNGRLGSRWTGQLGGRRERTLAGFANTLLLEKDVYDTTTYSAGARFDAGPRWRALLNAREATTRHENAARRRDDGELRAGSVGLEYHTPRGSSLGWEYRKAVTAFPLQALPGAVAAASDYDEGSASVKLGYVFTDKVRLNASAGYVERTYELAPNGDFSGDVWNAILQWSPTLTTRIVLQRWRELKAHLDAESDHFVADGEGVVASWSPMDTLVFALQVTREDQRYIGADADPLVGPTRRDEPLSAMLRLTYAPRERASFELAYRDERRESNRSRYDYDAAALSLAVELKF